MEIINFCIISHVDHGKSTLADRFLELTDTVKKNKMRPQYLDLMDLEREKGITIKMQPVRMEYKSYVLNLIDTPGHVDFSYEVSRALAAVEGAILLVDATKGIQAQTIHNLELAKKQNLVIIPAVNKIDSSQARVADTKTEISQILDIAEEEIFSISAKEGTNVKELLDKVIEKVPRHSGKEDSPFKALIFDSKYDAFKGVVAYIRVFEGKIRQGENIFLLKGNNKAEVKEVGYFKPKLIATGELKAGEIGYLATGIKESAKVRVGDTISLFGSDLEPLSGYKEPKQVVFASIYPEQADDFTLLKDGMNKLQLSDPSFTFELVSKEALGRGYLCGFLGSLHAEIVVERLQREFKLSLVISHPSVVFKVYTKKEIFVFSPADWPDQSLIEKIEEPWAKIEVVAPKSYFGPTMETLGKIEGKHVETKFLGKEHILVIYEVPLREIIKDFYDKLKGSTQGFASMNYEIIGFREADLVKLDILIAGKKEDAFSKIVPKEKAHIEGRKIVKKLKEVLPPQQFALPLQAVLSGKIIARETISARRKDVIAPLYGGDYTRKKKLLEKQKKGKKKLKGRSSSVKISPKVFLEVFKSS
ncbi:translation elongation factor 4 [Patescibacteria group bacterium]